MILLRIRKESEKARMALRRTRSIAWVLMILRMTARCSLNARASAFFRVHQTNSYALAVD
jgi:hypothetical protein